jgi:hypothetical protein
MPSVVVRLAGSGCVSENAAPSIWKWLALPLGSMPPCETTSPTISTAELLPPLKVIASGSSLSASTAGSP